MAVATVRAHPGKYEKDFDAVVAFLIQYIDKNALTPSMKVASVTQTRPAKRQKTSTSCGTFRGKIELKKWHSASNCMNSRKEPGSYRVRRPQKAAQLQRIECVF